MKTPAWLKSILRFFELDQTTCYVCDRPLGGNWIMPIACRKCWMKMEQEANGIINGSNDRKAS